MAADDAGGQAGGIGAGDAHAVHVHGQQFPGAHGGGQVQRHIVAPAAVDVLHAVDLPRAQRRKAGAGPQQVVFHLAFGDLFHRALHAAHGAQFGHHQAEADGGAAHRVLIDEPVDGLGQRLHVQAAAAHHVQKEVVQFLGLQAVGHFQHVMDLQPAPKVLGLLAFAHCKQAAVQCANAGTRDNIRRPVQLLQRLPHTHLVAAFGTAAGQHKGPLRAGFSCLLHGNFLPLLYGLIIASSAPHCHREAPNILPKLPGFAPGVAPAAKRVYHRSRNDFV